MVKLTDMTIQLVNRLFAESDCSEALKLLKSDCGTNLPLLHSGKNERIRFAVIKLSEGNLAALYDAVRLAQKDWRDVLVFAGFGDDTEAHETWANEILC